VPEGCAADWNQALMELGATVCTARAPACEACPAASCRSQGRPAIAPTARRSGAERVRFEDSDRYVRGRVVAALAAGEPVPGGFAPERLERALAGLERDGLVVREGGTVRLP
jgi:A/G-specific adenine glycosylase